MQFKNNLALFLQVANYLFSLAQRLSDNCPVSSIRVPPGGQPMPRQHS